MSPKDRKHGIVDPKNFAVVRAIGKGGQGECVLVKENKTGKLFVRKTMYNPWLSNGEPVEIRILCDILPYNKRIVHLAQAAIYPDDSHLHLEYCDGGDLASLIKRHAKAESLIPEGLLWHVFVHLAEALAFIHYGWGESKESMARWNPVIHRDIKPENVFLMKRKDGGYPDVILGDFGLAAVTTDRDHKVDCPCGTFAWQPPELPAATKRGDVWSIGAIIHAMAHLGQPPIARFPDYLPKNREHRMAWERNGRSRQVRSIYPKFSKQLQEWMMTCLEIDPAKRISSLELVNELGSVGRKARDANHQKLASFALPNTSGDPGPKKGGLLAPDSPLVALFKGRPSPKVPREPIVAKARPSPLQAERRPRRERADESRHPRHREHGHREHGHREIVQLEHGHREIVQLEHGRRPRVIVDLSELNSTDESGEYEESSDFSDYEEEVYLMRPRHRDHHRDWLEG